MWEWGVLPIWGIHSVIVQPWQRTRQDQDFPGNSLPTRWVFRCYFTGDSKGGFQSLVQNHSSKSQILANLHFTIGLVGPVSGSDLLKHVQDTGAGGGDLNFAYLDRPPPPETKLWAELNKLLEERGLYLYFSAAFKVWGVVIIKTVCFCPF